MSSLSFMPDVMLERRDAERRRAGVARSGRARRRGGGGSLPVSVYDHASPSPDDGDDDDDGGNVGGWRDRLGSDAIDSIFAEAGRDGDDDDATAEGGDDDDDSRDDGGAAERSEHRRRKRELRKRKEREEKAERSANAIEVNDDDDDDDVDVDGGLAVDDDGDLVLDDGGVETGGGGIDWHRSGSLGAPLVEVLDSVQTPPAGRSKRRPRTRGSDEEDEQARAARAKPAGKNRRRQRTGGRDVGRFMGNDDEGDLLGAAEEQQRVDRGDLTASSSCRRRAAKMEPTVRKKGGGGNRFCLGASPSQNRRRPDDEDGDDDAREETGDRPRRGRARIRNPSSSSRGAAAVPSKVNKMGMINDWNTDRSRWTGGSTTAARRQRKTEGGRRQEDDDGDEEGGTSMREEGRRESPRRRQQELQRRRRERESRQQELKRLKQQGRQQQQGRQHRTPKASVPLFDSKEVLEVEDESDSDGGATGDNEGLVSSSARAMRRAMEGLQEETEESATTATNGKRRGRGGEGGSLVDDLEEASSDDRDREEAVREEERRRGRDSVNPIDVDSDDDVYDDGPASMPIDDDDRADRLVAEERNPPRGSSSSPPSPPREDHRPGGGGAASPPRRSPRRFDGSPGGKEDAVPRGGSFARGDDDEDFVSRDDGDKSSATSRHKENEVEPMDLSLQEEEEEERGRDASASASPWSRGSGPEDRTAAAVGKEKLRRKKQDNDEASSARSSSREKDEVEPMDLSLQEEEEEVGNASASRRSRGGGPEDGTAAAIGRQKLRLKKTNNQRTNRKDRAAKKITPGASLLLHGRSPPEGDYGFLRGRSPKVDDFNDDIESFSSQSQSPGGTNRRRRRCAPPLRNGPTSLERVWRADAERHRNDIDELRREELHRKPKGSPENGSRFKKRAGKTTGIHPGSFHAKTSPRADDATFASPRNATSSRAKKESRRSRGSRTAERVSFGGDITRYTTALRRSGRHKRKDGGERDDAIEISDDSSSSDAEAEFEFDGGRGDGDQITEEEQIQMAKNESMGLPSKKRRTFGNRPALDVIRIAIGKKIVSSGCKFSFQPGSTNNQYIHFEYVRTASLGRVNDAAAAAESGQEVKEHKIFLNDIEALNYYLADEAEEAKSREPACGPRDDDPAAAAEAMHETEPKRRLSLSSERDDPPPMTFIAMRVTPRSANGLDAYSTSYLQSTERFKISDDCKKYLVFEIRSDEEFQKMINLMKGDGYLKNFLESGKLEADQVYPYVGALLEDDRADERRRRMSATSPSGRTRTGRSLRSAAGSSSSRGASSGPEDETLLVYPFSAEPDELERAADGLQEASVRDIDDDDDRETDVERVREEGAAASSSGSDAGVESGGSGKTTKGSGRTHYLTIREEDVARLEPGEFLNDTLVDFWMRWIRRHEDPDCDHPVHIFTSHFYTTLCDDGPNAVASWTAKKNIDIFSKKFIFIPINESLHWSLCVVTNPGNILHAWDKEGAKEDKEWPCMFFFDSLKAHRKVRVANNVRLWLNFLWDRAYWDQPELDSFKSPFRRATMEVHDPKIPYQNNSWDCGVFVCRYAFGLYQLRHRKITLRDDKKKHKWITRSAEFQFYMSDIARLRREMKTLVSNLSKIYIDAKKKEAEAKRAKKVKANRDATSGKGMELIDKEDEEHGSHVV